MKLVRVPLRVSLAGGGSDLPAHFERCGGAVVSATINKYIYIAAKSASGLYPHKYRLVYSKVEECNSVDEIQHPIIKTLCKDYDVESLDLDVMSDVPSGTGLGSSSAFTVGLHTALGGLIHPHIRAMAACETEVEDLKEPIGYQDQYAAAYGGLNLIEFTKEKVLVRPLGATASAYALEQCLHLVYLGRSRSASKHLSEQKLDHRTLNKMAASAQVVASYIRNGYIEEIGEVIRHGWELKKSLSPHISNERIDSIIDTAISHGATGGKLLGAGGTGFVLLFCPPNNLGRMKEGLSHMDLTWVPFEMEWEGAKVLYES